MKNPANVETVRERIRARYFPTWPGAVLFLIPEGLSLTVQGLEAPFGPEEFASACDNVQASEGVPGRWTQTLIRAHTAAKAERGQRNRLREATEASMLRGAIDPREKDRGKLILEKQAVDERTRLLKERIAEAKSRAAATGRFMNPTQFRQLERQLDEAKQLSQALQTQLGQLRTAKQGTFEKAFVDAAREMLDAEQFDVLLDRARELAADDDERRIEGQRTSRLASDDLRQSARGR